MSIRSASVQSHVTLVLSTILHAFTHAYASLLVPLYLLIRQDLHLPGVNAAALIVTIYLLTFTSLSYPAGVLADRFDRRWMLGIGLIGNAVTVLLMGLTHSYAILLVLGALSGVFAALFHPSANALVPDHYPDSPGMAMGLLSIGSGIGFFSGPLYAGWRAQNAAWQVPWLRISDWQYPCIELGLLGIVVGIIFIAVARESPSRKQHRMSRRNNSSGRNRRDEYPPMGRRLRWQMVALSAILGCRDFAGVGALTLASLYLQKAWNMDAGRVGFLVGLMMLFGVIINPISVWITGGARRLPALMGILVAGGIILASAPFWPLLGTVAAFCAFQAMQQGSYAVSDAAITERIHPILRGRVTGMFLSLAGTFSATSPWILGWWTDQLGTSASQPRAYVGQFILLGGMIAFAAFSTLIITRLRQPHATMTAAIACPSGVQA